MKTVLLALCAAFLLTGCVTTYEGELALDDHDQCVSYGAKPGTEAYTNCRLTLSNQNAYAAAQRRQSGAALVALGTAVKNQPAPRMRQTTCSQNGDYVNCTSY